ncbi:aminotransferase class V-fold PLP-dependent enzyme [Bosea sp. WAO]|uniref:aminotransferase class V-fold PLP-dependent enzyme n=1 Tax=Bosea sp. WAO TaxID=406341 RepID=UPI0017C7BAB2|nr:aminotransferase class V-fold PLP-dependent enzyme [Bosea sp. WAO]
MSEATLAAVTEQLRREALYGPHEASVAVQDRLDQARADAGRLVNATAAEIAFTSSGSAGWGLAFAALPSLRAGDRILVGRQEWGGNLATMQRAAARAGATIEVIACREDGSVDSDALAGMIDERVRLVALTWLPANGGLINDAVAVGRVTRAAGVPYFVDAGQALGQIPVDVAAIGCDVLKGAGRKHLRGPRGTAILYVRGSFQSQLDTVFSDVLSAPWTAQGTGAARRCEDIRDERACGCAAAGARRRARGGAGARPACNPGADRPNRDATAGGASGHRRRRDP